MGVEGCGYATVIAQAISALLCLVYIAKKFDVLRLHREDFRFSMQSIKKLLALGVPMGLQFSITAIGTIIVQGAINVYGAVYMAGFSAAGKIQNIISTVFIAFGATIATYVGQNRGAGKMDRVRKGVYMTQGMILIWSFVLMAVIHFFGQYLMLIFVDVAASDAEINSELILSFQKGLQGGRAKTFTVNAGAGQHIFYALPTSYGACSFNVGGFDGGFSKVSTFEFTNAQGHAENYDVYKSTNANLGNTTVKVS